MVLIFLAFKFDQRRQLCLFAFVYKNIQQQLFQNKVVQTINSIMISAIFQSLLIPLRLRNDLLAFSNLAINPNKVKMVLITRSSPKIVLSLYDTIGKPSKFYGIFVWWSALEKTLARKFESNQRTTLICICGALRFTPIMALNVILQIVPRYHRQVYGSESCYRSLKIRKSSHALTTYRIIWIMESPKLNSGGFISARRGGVVSG